jgi:hypothetical protein
VEGDEVLFNRLALVPDAIWSEPYYGYMSAKFAVWRFVWNASKSTRSGDSQ